MKKERGITLVALVITVIIMLILAGVAISQITGEEGLLARANHAVKQYENATQKEAEILNSILKDNYLQIPDGSWDDEAKVNSPDVSKLPEDRTYYVTWESNTSEPKMSKIVPENWYDYSAGKWANIKSENTVDGTLLEAYWVWIPRFAYKLSESTTPEEIEVMFLENDTDYGYIEGVKTQAYHATSTEITTDGSGLYSKRTSTVGEKWVIHPAFWWDDDNDGEMDTGEQLNGIWVAKFEPSNPDCTLVKATGENSANNVGTTKLTVKPNVTAWRTTQLATAFASCKNALKEGGVIGNNLGNLDLHPAKNMEWGCVAILSQSKYGIFSSGSTITDLSDGTSRRVWNNPSNDYITGSVGSDPDQANGEVTAYNSANGAKASTTGTIYGVYDMAGGGFECVMGLMAPVGEETVTRETVGAVGTDDSFNIGFNGKLADGTEYSGGSMNLPDRKYYNVYSYGTSSNNEAAYARGYIGDATSEFAKWNGEGAIFVCLTKPEFVRSGGPWDGKLAGVFYFYYHTSRDISLVTFRPVLIGM